MSDGLNDIFSRFEDMFSFQALGGGRLLSAGCLGMNCFVQMLKLLLEFLQAIQSELQAFLLWASGGLVLLLDFSDFFVRVRQLFQDVRSVLEVVGLVSEDSDSLVTSSSLKLCDLEFLEEMNLVMIVLLEHFILGR